MHNENTKTPLLPDSPFVVIRLNLRLVGGVCFSVLFCFYRSEKRTDWMHQEISQIKAHWIRISDDLYVPRSRWTILVLHNATCSDPLCSPCNYVDQYTSCFRVCIGISLDQRSRERQWCSQRVVQVHARDSTQNLLRQCVSTIEICAKSWAGPLPWCPNSPRHLPRADKSPLRSQLQSASSQREIRKHKRNALPFPSTSHAISSLTIFRMLAMVSFQICEQFNSFLQHIKYTGSKFTQCDFMFFAQFMVMMWNTTKIKRWNRRNAQLQSLVDSAKDSLRSISWNISDWAQGVTNHRGGLFKPCQFIRICRFVSQNLCCHLDVFVHAIEWSNKDCSTC